MSLLRLLLHVIAHFQIFHILHLRSETEGEGHESYRSQCTFLMTHLDQGSGMKDFDLYPLYYEVEHNSDPRLNSLFLQKKLSSTYQHMYGHRQDPKKG